MNTHSKSLIAALLICPPLIVLATEEPAPQQLPGAPAQADSPSMSMHDQAMADQIRNMQAAHDKIAAARTPAERQVAMREFASHATLRRQYWPGDESRHGRARPQPSGRFQ